mmetsp:Transcript_40443/g.74001  ORF Transcript_40443/g.74001 Transcript_40443/m.74001 type:complete len:243 (+) Transcript_40443:864-1592(+)
MTLTIVDTAIKFRLPKIRSQLLQHNLNRHINNTTANTRLFQRLILKPRLHQRRPMRFQQIEQIRRPHQRQLEYLTKPIRYIPRILRRNKRRIQQTSRRRIETPHAVFVCFVRDATAVVDAVLHSDAGIDDGEEGGGYADEGYAATVEAGGHAGDVEDAAAADGEEGFATAEFVGAEIVEDGVDGTRPLIRLAPINHTRRQLNPSGREITPNPIPIQLIHLGIYDRKSCIIPLRMNTGCIQQL